MKQINKKRKTELPDFERDISLSHSVVSASIEKLFEKAVVNRAPLEIKDAGVLKTLVEVLTMLQKLQNGGEDAPQIVNQIAIPTEALLARLKKSD